MEREANFRPFENVRDLPPLLRSFVRDPIGTMKKPMRLSWPAALSLQAGMAIVSGVLNGALTKNFWDFLAGLLVFPVISVCLGLALAGFTHQFYAIFQSTYLEFRRLHSMVVVATLPYFLLHVLSGLV